MSHQVIIDNIDYTRELCRLNHSIGKVVLVCGSADDQSFLENLFRRHSADLFNVDQSTHTSVFEERLGSKTRQGNFLGALLAYQQLHQEADFQSHCANSVVLMGMVFGRGERISPFSQVMGNRKALISVMSPRLDPGDAKALTSIEEAMYFFAPLAVALQRGGFRGILCKWGDETQIPSVSLSELSKHRSFLDSDVIKCVAQVPITLESASQKDWVVFDAANNRMITQCSRNEKSVLENTIADWKKRYPQAQAGVSLGPVAVSYRVLDLALEIFAADIERDGVFLDFDPYVIQALGFDDDDAVWNAAAEKDAGLQKIIRMIPDFFSKIKTLKSQFTACYGRPLKVEVLDLGADLHWADIGQHAAFAEKVFSVNENSPRGQIARKIEDIPDIPGIRDARGNLVMDSFVAPGVDVFNSVIIRSVITGKGTIVNSVIKNSLLHDVKINKAFVLHSARVSVNLEDNSGLYGAVGARPVTLAANERLGTLLTDGGPEDLKVSQTINLQNKADNYDRAIFDNRLSFAEAFDIMRSLSMQTLEERRRRESSDVTEVIVEYLFNLLQNGLITEEKLNCALAVIAVQIPRK